jgi:UPF0716 family protein affecting phage T7 exclusion
MRKLSYAGFFAMVVLGIGAFAWVNHWWATVLLLVLALAVGWWSLGLYMRASIGSAQRVLRGEASPEDYQVIEELGTGRAHEEAFRAAAEEEANAKDD